MGVVVRQGLKSTIVQFAGVGIGIFATLFLWPMALKVVGLVQTIIAAAAVIAPVSMLGSYVLAVRYYAPYSNPDAGRRGLLTLLLAICTVGVLLTALAWPLFDELVARTYFAEYGEDARTYLVVIPLLVAAVAYARLVSQYTTNFRRVVVPTLIEQFAFKVTLPVLVLLYIGGYLTERGVVIGTLIHYWTVVVLLAGYLVYLGEWRVPRIDEALRDKWREMASYGGYGMAAMAAGQLAFRIDQLMVSAYLGFTAGGQYTLALFIAEVIAKPYTNLRMVTAPMVSEAWADNDLPELRTLYRKSSDNLLLICGYVFLGIAVCYPALVDVAPRGEVLAQAFGAFLLLGLARVVDGATSINELIITFSPKYWYNLVGLVIMAGVNIALNVLLIPRYGFVGAGLSTLLSIVLSNLAKVLFVGLQWGLWPFGKTTFEVAIALLLAGLLAYLLPLTGYWPADMVLKGGLLTVLLATYVWLRPPSEELRGLLQKAVRLLPRT